MLIIIDRGNSRVSVLSLLLPLPLFLSLPLHEKASANFPTIPRATDDLKTAICVGGPSKSFNPSTWEVFSNWKCYT